jgi:hypothetical protein
VVTKDGVASTFVWIPVFQAYQLIRPDRCGYPDQAVGVWVAHPPTSGARDVDWAVETFGGFYAGKFQASRADAVPGHTETGSGATAGASSTLKVARYCVPWTNVTWDQARTACAAYDAHCHLMADDEWTALAVWSMVHGVTVHGNNSNGADSRDDAVTFLIDPTCGGRALTGTGTKAGWSGPVNLTTHTAATDGVYDLTGNVMEWTATLGGAKGSNRYMVNDMETGVSMPRSGPISTLSTDTRLRRYGVPGSTGTDRRAFGGNYFGSNDRLFTVSMRGGLWNFVSFAGVWSLSLGNARTYSSVYVGFRPVLRF